MRVSELLGKVAQVRAYGESASVAAAVAMEALLGLDLDQEAELDRETERDLDELVRSLPELIQLLAGLAEDYGPPDED